jgi:ribonuclease HI
MTFGPLIVSPNEAATLTAIKSSPIDNMSSRILYSDGSLLHSGTEDVAMGFSVVDPQQDIHLPIKGRTDGHASSTKAELMGLIAAVVATPDEQDIVVRLDNQSVVDQFQHMVQDRENTLPRKRFRSTYAGLWAVLSHIVKQRHGTVRVEWVRGHNNDPGNELADATAKEAAHGGTVSWKVDLTQQEDIRAFAFCYGSLVEIDLRQLLKQQTTIRHHQQWTSQRRVKKAMPHLDDIEWRSTLALVHARRAVFTFYSSNKDTRQRSHHIKKLHGMLPTLNSMQARHPDLYPDRICRMCEGSDEDNAHLWTCPAMATTIQLIWQEAMDQIDGWGTKATNSYNATKKREHERAVANGRQLPRPVPVIWRCPTVEEHVRGFSSIGGARSVHQGQPVPDRDVNSKWHVSDLLRGITPKSMLSEWAPVFRTPQSIAQMILHRFIGYLEDKASELIWKPRCTATAAWEQSIGITPKAKASKYNGPRGDWSDGYGFITQPGFCPCGASLDAHEDEHCPGSSSDPTAADARLLESLLGRRRLSLMERMGRIPFIRVCE